MASFTFPPGRRLRRRGDFQRVFDSGRRAHGRYFTIIAAPAQGPDSRLGIVASRKLGGAVVRNRAKRLIRQAFRTQPSPGAPFDLVVIPKPALLDADSEALSLDFRQALKRCYMSKQ
jgi:ribonuclease P protein component